MTRPAVSVVMPFAGTPAEAEAALAALTALRTAPGDELLFVDNGRIAVAARPERITIVRASEEHSPAYARNVGAERAGNAWILFLDADTQPPADLLDAYFADGEPAASIGALAGEVTGAAGEMSVASRYGVARGFLSQAAHLAHPYRPRAVAANLLVRRDAFEQIGGFYEGVRAAEDTDFSWRLQQAGWGLELRSRAGVEHVYRSTVRDLRRQWRGYAAGRAWLGRRYDGFTPEPALRRVLRGRGRRSRKTAARPPDRAGTRAPRGSRRGAPTPRPSALERVRHLLLDGVLAVEELFGFVLSNRPRRRRAGRGVQVVLIADQFPAQDDPLVEVAQALGGVRVEAIARPARILPATARSLHVNYREDDGAAARAAAFTRLVARHPLRTVRAARAGQRGLVVLAPAALRLARDPSARLQPLGGGEAERIAAGLALLAGRRLGTGGSG